MHTVIVVITQNGWMLQAGLKNHTSFSCLQWNRRFVKWNLNISGWAFLFPLRSFTCWPAKQDKKTASKSIGDVLNFMLCWISMGWTLQLIATVLSRGMWNRTSQHKTSRFTAAVSDGIRTTFPPAAKVTTRDDASLLTHTHNGHTGRKFNTLYLKLQYIQ